MIYSSLTGEVYNKPLVDGKCPGGKPVKQSMKAKRQEVSMGMFHRVQVGEQVISPIDWEMCPELSFGTYESWGGRERVRSNDERVYYFVIDNWGDEPRLLLMERGVKHARVLAEIAAPRGLVAECVAEQGWAARFEQTFGINARIREWLIGNVLDSGESSLVVPIVEDEEYEDMGPTLPSRAPGGTGVVALPSASCFLQEDEVDDLIASWDFFDAEKNPGGGFANSLVAGPDENVVIDRATNLMWQRGGLDINSIRRIRREIEEINERGLAGYHDWRLPTVEEALSLMESACNTKGVHLDPCFSCRQPFIFVAAQRKPGGYWFVDYKQGRTFWSSGTIPGGFARMVRTLD